MNIIYLILIILSLILSYFIISVNRDIYLKKKRKEQEQQDEISGGITDYRECIEIPESEMKRELRKFNLSHKDWLHRKKHILMQKLSRRKNRK